MLELYKEILIKAMENKNVNVAFEGLEINSTEIVQMECYRALYEIKTIIEDDSLEDSECFMKIEEIVCIFEALGSDCGSRHDFG